MKTLQMILRGLGVTLEGLANGIAWAGFALQDASEELPATVYRAQMALTRSRTAFKRIWHKARTVARMAWSGASRGLLGLLGALASVVVVVFLVGKVAWDFLGVAGRILVTTGKRAWHILITSGKRAWGFLGAMGAWSRCTAAFVATWAEKVVVNVGTWAKSAWTFRQELTREWAT